MDMNYRITKDTYIEIIPMLVDEILCGAPATLNIRTNKDACCSACEISEINYDKDRDVMIVHNDCGYVLLQNISDGIYSVLSTGVDYMLRGEVEGVTFEIIIESPALSDYLEKNIIRVDKHA